MIKEYNGQQTGELDKFAITPVLLQSSAKLGLSADKSLKKDIKIMSIQFIGVLISMLLISPEFTSYAIKDYPLIYSLYLRQSPIDIIT